MRRHLSAERSGRHDARSEAREANARTAIRCLIFAGSAELVRDQRPATVVGRLGRLDEESADLGERAADVELLRTMKASDPAEERPREGVGPTWDGRPARRAEGPLE
jgi:hypothetical protein